MAAHSHSHSLNSAAQRQREDSQAPLVASALQQQFLLCEPLAVLRSRSIKYSFLQKQRAEGKGWAADSQALNRISMPSDQDAHSRQVQIKMPGDPQLLPVGLQRVGPSCSLPCRRQLPLGGRLAAQLALRSGEAEANRGAGIREEAPGRTALGENAAADTSSQPGQPALLACRQLPTHLLLFLGLVI